jgi:hypothetical protein
VLKGSRDGERGRQPNARLRVLQETFHCPLDGRKLLRIPEHSGRLNSDFGVRIFEELRTFEKGKREVGVTTAIRVPPPDDHPQAPKRVQAG